jgi:hypothetical protein
MPVKPKIEDLKISKEEVHRDKNGFVDAIKYTLEDGTTIKNGNPDPSIWNGGLFESK